MIFATVGTTQFDELVVAIDKIAPELNEEVVIQMGYYNRYIPHNCKYFTFTDNVLKYYKEATVIIAHGGAGVTFEVLNLGKKLISVENPHALDGHQGDLLSKLSQDGYLIWCKNLDHIKNHIERARNINIKKYIKPECNIGKMIDRFLLRN